MSNLLKWVSVLLFLSTPAFLVAGIWVGESKFFWIAIVNLLFSMFSGAFAESIKRAQFEQSTLF